jgi:hypothetical protein
MLASQWRRDYSNNFILKISDSDVDRDIKYVY